MPPHRREAPQRDRAATTKQEEERRARGIYSLFDLDLDADTIENTAVPSPEDLLRRDFRRVLKAFAMDVRLPIQLLTPKTFRGRRQGAGGSCDSSVEPCSRSVLQGRWDSMAHPAARRAHLLCGDSLFTTFARRRHMLSTRASRKRSQPKVTGSHFVGTPCHGTSATVKSISLRSR